jgi:hypothetical protein
VRRPRQCTGAHPPETGPFPVLKRFMLALYSTFPDRFRPSLDITGRDKRPSREEHRGDGLLAVATTRQHPPGRCVPCVRESVLFGRPGGAGSILRWCTPLRPCGLFGPWWFESSRPQSHETRPGYPWSGNALEQPTDAAVLAPERRRPNPRGGLERGLAPPAAICSSFLARRAPYPRNRAALSNLWMHKADLRAIAGRIDASPKLSPAFALR